MFGERGAWLGVFGALVAGGCFFDPVGSVVGDSATGETSTGAHDSSTGTLEPTTDATLDTTSSGTISSETGGPMCGDGALDPGEACDLGDDNGQGDSTCSLDCTLRGCGDGEVTAPEQCDDGNEVEDDGCSNLCKLPACGDGFVTPGEACDLGRDNGDDRSCTADCEDAVCGDGLVLAGVEECDDGDDDDLDECHDCELNKCGDGFAGGPGEACDHGPLNVDGGLCTTTCERNAYWVFVTAAQFNLTSGFHSRAEADALCTSLAASHGVQASFRAWLSDGESGPATDFFPSPQPYAVRSVQNTITIVAADLPDLLDGSLLAPISRSEDGQQVVGEDCDGGVVWTGTTAAGVSANKHCEAWTNNLFSPVVVGSLSAIDTSWTQSPCEDWSCSAFARLYCFEQP